MIRESIIISEDCKVMDTHAFDPEIGLPPNNTPGFRRFPYGEYWDRDARTLWRGVHRRRRIEVRDGTDGLLPHSVLRVMSINICPSPQGRPLAYLVQAEAQLGH